MSNHALYSPSASERWIRCPGSVRLSRDIPRVESEAAIVGTNHHTLLEHRLKGLPVTKELKAQINYTREMGRRIGDVITIIDNDISKVKNKKNLDFGAEVKSDCSELVNADMWGTSDVVIAEVCNTLHVQDYKNGTHIVNARENSQGLAYVLGIAHKFDYMFESYKFSILQPTSTGRIMQRSWEFGFDRLMKQKEIFRSAIALSKKRNAPLQAGAWCWFCPASKTCPLKKEQRWAEVRNDFEETN